MNIDATKLILKDKAKMRLFIQFTLFSVLIFNSLFAVAQEIKDKGELREQSQTENTLIFKVANSRFESILLNEYKGLPRVRTAGSLENPSDRVKIKIENASFENYFMLLEMKLFNDYYKVLDTDNIVGFSDNTNNYNKDEKKALLVQEHLKQIALKLTTDEAYISYFCEGGKDQCYQWKRRFSKIWGGNAINVFSRRKTFKSFVNDNFGDLQKLAGTVNEELYLVTLLKFGEYDFNTNSFSFTIGDLYDFKIGKYKPIHKYENLFNDKKKSIKSHKEFKKFHNKNKINPRKLSLDMSPEKAETFLNKNKDRKLYGVYKIKFKRNSLDTANNKDAFSITFHLTSPIMELYMDEDLIDKVRDFDISKIVVNKENHTDSATNSPALFAVGDKVMHKFGRSKIGGTIIEIKIIPNKFNNSAKNEYLVRYATRSDGKIIEKWVNGVSLEKL